jgi:hypothetical protein
VPLSLGALDWGAMPKMHRSNHSPQSYFSGEEEKSRERQRLVNQVFA